MALASARIGKEAGLRSCLRLLGPATKTTPAVHVRRQLRRSSEQEPGPILLHLPGLPEGVLALPPMSRWGRPVRQVRAARGQAGQDGRPAGAAARSAGRSAVLSRPSP
jgi:hypothetical protein